MSAASPTVSVALCTYQGQAYVHEQLASIAAQTLPPQEVVICDDGSTDATVDVITAFIATYTGPIAFRLLDTTRVGGVVPNFSRALAACTGELIALSDQDDVWHPDRLAAAVPAFADASLLLLNADATLVDGAGAPLGDTLLSTLYASAADLARFHAREGFALLLARNTVTGATTLLRRTLLEDALPIPPHWVHDEWLALLAAARGGHDTLERAVIDYRLHGGNQIGATAPTLRHKLRQVFSPRGNRLTVLAERAALAVERLEGMDVPPEVLDLARRKLAFDGRRAAYPAARRRRLAPLWREWRRGDYPALASQGRMDLLRDLLQPGA